jgi:DNA-binding LacI/PurR family transcriptional regulator
VSGLDNVRSETRERVEKAMRDLLYVPPGRSAATGVIGLLLPDFENPIFRALAQAMENRATEAGFASPRASSRTTSSRTARSA